MARFTTFVKASPVEAFCGLFLVILGLALTAASGWPRVAGNVCAAVGGVLLSWITATYLSEERVAAVKAEAAAAQGHALTEQQDHFSTQIAAVSRQLGTSSAQIKEAVNLTVTGHWAPETCFALVQQSTASLYGLVNELQSMLGDRFDPDTILETASTLGDLGTRLHEITSQPALASAETRSELVGVVEAIDELTRRLQPAAEGVAGAAASDTLETVSCPTCDATVRFRLGNLSGSTQMPTCGACGNRFNAHRARDGAVFTNTKVPLPSPSVSRVIDSSETVACPACERPSSYTLPAFAGATMQHTCPYCNTVFNLHRAAGGGAFTRLAAPSGPDFVIHCPECTDEIPVRNYDSARERTVRNCFACGEEITIDLVRHDIVSHHATAPPLDGALDPTSKARVVCPTCQETARVIAHHGEYLYGKCQGCGRLVRAVEPEQNRDPSQESPPSEGSQDLPEA